jgi:hypothetical protein
MRTAAPFAKCDGTEMAAPAEEKNGGPGLGEGLGAWGEAGTPLL